MLRQQKQIKYKLVKHMQKNLKTTTAKQGERSLCVLVTQSCLTLRPHGLQPSKALLSMEFFRQEYWSGGFSFRGFFPNQGSNPGFLHCGQILYHLSHQGSLDMAKYSFKDSMNKTVSINLILLILEEKKSMSPLCFSCPLYTF